MEEKKLDKKLQQFKQMVDIQGAAKGPQGKVEEEEFFNEMTTVLKNLKDLKKAKDEKSDEPVDIDRVKKILANKEEANLYSFQSSMAGKAGEEKKEASVVPFLEGHDLEELRKSVKD